MRPFGERHLEGPQRRERYALVGAGARDHVDQIDVVADLGYGRARHDGAEGLRQILRAEPQEARLVLIDPDLKRARRLDPVVVHLFDEGVRRQDLGHLEGDLAHLSGVRPAYPILQRPANRRSQFQGVDPPDDARELGRKRLLQPGLDALALFQALRHDHGLGEEVVRKLQVERQVEPDRARGPHRCSSAPRPGHPSRGHPAAPRRLGWRRSSRSGAA